MGDGGTVGAACMAARGELAVSASLRRAEVRHGRAMRAPTAGDVRRGCIRRVGAARADMKSAPTGLLSGYS